MTHRRTVLSGILGLGLAVSAGGAALAQEAVKIGLILPMTGPFASTGRQIDAAVKLFLAKEGAVHGGRKLDVILKDDAGNADRKERCEVVGEKLKDGIPTELKIGRAC